MRNLPRPLVRGLAVASIALTPVAVAQRTWVVDDDPGPGVHFTAIQPALDQAGPYDLIDVRPGTYGPFDMQAPRRIMGVTGARVTGVSTIRSVPAGTWALLADIRVESIDVTACQGAVVLEGLQLHGAAGALSVSGSQDVRIDRCDLTGSADSPCIAIFASNVQLSQTAVVCGPHHLLGAQGIDALYATSGSWVHVVDSMLVGGGGGEANWSLGVWMGGPGGAAARVSGGALLRLSRSTLTGGQGGYDPYGVPQFDGPASSALIACGGAHTEWQCTLSAGQPWSSWPPPPPAVDLACGATLTPLPDSPTLTLDGPLTPGSVATYELHAAAGSAAVLSVGRVPVFVQMLDSVVPQLASTGRTTLPATIPQTEVLTLPLVVPQWPRGTVMFAQAGRVDAVGLELTNSVTFLVR